MEPVCVTSRGLRQSHEPGPDGACSHCRAPVALDPARPLAAAPATVDVERNAAHEPPSGYRRLTDEEFRRVRDRCRRNAIETCVPLGCGPDSPYWTSAWLLLAGLLCGFHEETLAEFSEVPRAIVAAGLERMRRNGLLPRRGRQALAVRWNRGSEDEAVIAFVLDVLVVAGHVERSLPKDSFDYCYRVLPEGS